MATRNEFDMDLEFDENINKFNFVAKVDMTQHNKRRTAILNWNSSVCELLSQPPKRSMFSKVYNFITERGVNLPKRCPFLKVGWQKFNF